jgi:hypothetical protein
MGILDVLYSPWAILPEHLAQMQEIYAAHIRGEHLEARRSAPWLAPFLADMKSRMVWLLFQCVAQLPSE